MGSFPPPMSTLSYLLIFTIIITTTTATTYDQQPGFKCNSPGTCTSILGYLPPNTTTIFAITTFFNLNDSLSLLGANNLPPSTPLSYPIPAKQEFKIPVPCICTNGTGTARNPPVYKVVPDDGLYHIAAEVFSGLVTYPQIQAFNNISDPNLISVGQELKIPLPCSCDEVAGEKVVHYGHAVAGGSTVDGIAREYNTNAETLLKLNGLASPEGLLANSSLDVPLKACTSMVSNTSLDYPLLVPNGTYVFTAGSCVMCKCDATNNFTLQCAPFERTTSQIRSSFWRSCPTMQCQSAENLYIGNTTFSSCSRTTCAYAGYTNQTILTTVASDPTCPVSDNNKSDATKSGLQGWSWNSLLIAVQLLLLSLQ